MKLFSPRAARILAIDDLNPTTKMFSLDLSLGAVPGQFLNLWLPDTDEKPFSIAYDDGTTLKVAVAAIGPFTKKLFRQRVGDRLGVRGPFGNGFSLLKRARVALVGGGFGAAPLFFLGERLAQKKCSVSAIFGARSKDFLFYLQKSREAGFAVFPTTDDGSFGERGRVTAPLERLLHKKALDFVFCCGPEKMMEAVARLCERAGVSCEVSLERFMKCGFGVCGQCACDRKLVCRDGCVFTGKEVLGFEDFGRFTRDAEGRRVDF